MKKIFILSLSLIVSAALMVSCSKEKSSEQGISHDSAPKGTLQWHSFAKGYDMAKKAGKPMVIDFYADWCHWCKVMEEQTFSDSEVIKKMKDEYIAIRIHTDRPKKEGISFMGRKYTEQEFAAAMGVTGLPTLVFLDKDGKPITKIPGFVKKDVFLPLLSYFSEGCYLQNVSFDDYVEGKTPCSKGHQQKSQT